MVCAILSRRLDSSIASRIGVIIALAMCTPVWAESPFPDGEPASDRKETPRSTSAETGAPRTDEAAIAAREKQLEALKDRARSLLEKQHYEPALEVLEQAFEVSPTPLLMFNIAMCEKALSRHLDAMRSFRRFFELQRATGEGNPKLETMASDALDDLAPLVSTLDILDAPAGAEVTVDGNLVGTYPLAEPLYVVPGRHTVTVSSAKGESMTLDVIAAGGAKVPVRADLSTAPSVLEVQCNDALAELFIDDQPVGGCPFQGELDEGTHQIRIGAPGKKTVVQTITLAPRRTNLVSVDLSPVMQIDPPPSSPQRPAIDTPAERLFYTGLTVAVLGGAALGTGAGFAIAREVRARGALSLHDDISAARKSFEQTPPDDSEWRRYEHDWAAYEDDLQQVSRLRKGAIIGCAVGGSLLAIGAGILGYYWMKQRKEGASNVSIRLTNVEVSF